MFAQEAFYFLFLLDEFKHVKVWLEEIPQCTKV